MNNEQPAFLTPKELGRLFLFTILAIIVAQGLGAVLPVHWMVLVQELVIVLPALIMIRMKGWPWTYSFRIHRVRLSVLFWGFLFSMAVVVLTDELDRLLALFFPMPEILQQELEELMRAKSLNQALLLISGTVVMAAVSEEMLFRGIILQSLEQFKDAASAIVLSAIFFALIHFNPWAAIQIAVLGFVLGYLSWKSQSIWPAVLLHAANNLLAYLWVNIPRERWGWYCGVHHVKLEWLLLSALVLVIALQRFNATCDEQNEAMESLSHHS
jgi:membrane protease YdiL (CAAX protease family)